MLKAIKTKVRMQEDGKMELSVPQIPVGEEVDVIILFTAAEEKTTVAKKRSVMDILAETPGQQLFNTAEEVDEYIAGEKESWGK